MRWYNEEKFRRIHWPRSINPLRWLAYIRDRRRYGTHYPMIEEDPSTWLRVTMQSLHIWSR